VGLKSASFTSTWLEGFGPVATFKLSSAAPVLAAHNDTVPLVPAVAIMRPLGLNSMSGTVPVARPSENSNLPLVASQILGGACKKVEVATSRPFGLIDAWITR